MRIGNRLFPYPVLNNVGHLSSYKEDSTFAIHFEVDEEGMPYRDDNNLIFKNLHLELNDFGLKQLVEQGKIKALLIVECSASIFRGKYEIRLEPNDLKIPLKLLKGKTDISAYVFANEEILNYHNDNFLEDYQGYIFNIEKYSILAADDGFNISVDIDPKDYDKVNSIFTVVKVENDEKVVSYINDKEKIIIQLPKEFYTSYDSNKHLEALYNIYFATIAIPPLAACISEIQSAGKESFDDILEEHLWFGAIINAYKKIHDEELTFDVFEDINPFELAQQVLNYGSCNSVLNVGEIASNGNAFARSDDDDE